MRIERGREAIDPSVFRVICRPCSNPIASAQIDSEILFAAFIRVNVSAEVAKISRCMLGRIFRSLGKDTLVAAATITIRLSAILVPSGCLVRIVIIVAEVYVWGIFISATTTTVTTSASYNNWGLRSPWSRKGRSWVVVWWAWVRSTTATAATTVISTAISRSWSS
jgi:hypothetical protein